MLRPDLAPLDVYLADAMLLEPGAFVERHPWPVLIIAEPNWAKIRLLSRPETLGPGSRVPALLELIDPANAGASLDAMCLPLRPLDGVSADRMTIGRAPDADVVLLDETASKNHAELSWDAGRGRAVLTDLGSRNGTAVEGQRVAARGTAELAAGMVVTFGTLATRYYTPQGFLAWLVSGAARAGAVRAR